MKRKLFTWRGTAPPLLALIALLLTLGVVGSFPLAYAKYSVGGAATASGQVADFKVEWIRIGDIAEQPPVIKDKVKVGSAWLSVSTNKYEVVWELENKSEVAVEVVYLPDFFLRLTPYSGYSGPNHLKMTHSIDKQILLSANLGVYDKATLTVVVEPDPGVVSTLPAPPVVDLGASYPPLERYALVLDGDQSTNGKAYTTEEIFEMPGNAGRYEAVLRVSADVVQVD